VTFTALSLSQWLTLFGGVGGVVTLLYLLRLRRRRVEVPFGPLWAKVLQEKQTTSLFRVLKRYFSLLLQLAMILLLVTALADPQWDGSNPLLVKHETPREAQPNHTLLVLDASASMAATDVEGGRFAEAARRAHEVVDSMQSRERVMLARMDRDMTALTDWTEDRQALHTLINGMAPLDSGTSRAPLMQFARNAVRGLENAQVVLVSDRAFSPPDADLAGAIHMKVIPVGGGGTDNVAVLDFNVRSHLGNALRYATWYSLHNASEKAVQVRVWLYSDPNDMARTRAEFRALAPVGAAEVLELKPGETRVVERESVSLDGSRAALMIEPVDGSFTDIMPGDDVAYAVVPQRQSVKVQLVGETNIFLEAALGTRKHVSVTQVALADYTSSEGFDLTVFDGKAPETPGGGNHIYINVSEGGVPYAIKKGVKPGGKIKVPSARTRHPLMKFVRFVDLKVPELLRLKKKRGDVVMARGKAGRTAVLAHSSDKGRWVAVGFDPIATEWVGHYSFSIFFVNAINWFFAEETRLLRPWSLAKRWSVPVPWKGLDKVAMTLPDGSEREVLVDGGGTLVFTGQREGIYEVRHPDPPSAADARPILVAAALKSAEEADLTARGDYAVWQKPVPELTRAEPLRFLGADLWQLMIMVVMGVLCVEWLTYHRRMTV
jgi:hypothetical protein